MTSQAVAPAHRHGWYAVQMAVGVAVVLGLIAVLISVALNRGPAPVPSGQRTEQSVVVPHPSPGPYGS
jgi:hypothetical protein